MKKSVFLRNMMLITASIQAIHASIISITSEEDFNKIVESNAPSVILFSADWCGACSALKEPFQEVVDNPEFQNITFAKVDIDQNPTLARKQKLEDKGIPTLSFIQGKLQINEMTGVPNKPQETISAEIRKAFHMQSPEGTESTEQAPTESSDNATQPAGMDFFSTLINTFVVIFNYIKDMIMNVITKIQDLFSSK